MKVIPRILLALLIVLRPAWALPEPAGNLDALTFGDAASESAHQTASEQSDIVQGGLGESARRLLPFGSADWEGGKVSFTMKVDAKKPNYFTVRLWGSDLNTNRLILFCEGKQIGYRHLGDIDILNSANGSPGYNGRFFYETSPLPIEMTKGKTELHFEIRSTGRVWGYGSSFAQYQKAMTEPTRGLYRVYTHTDGCFVPAANEKQGSAPTDPPVRSQPGEEVLAKVKERIGKEIDGLLRNNKPLNQHQLWFLAKAYPMKGTPAYHNAAVVKKAVEAIDTLYVRYQADPKVAQAEPSIYNADWFGVGPAANAVVLLAEPFKPVLDQDINGASGVTRRAGWAEMFVACRDWHRAHRRQYTNQTMISDTYGIYFPNRAVALLHPNKALPEATALHYLYESAGLQPWLGSEKNGVPEKPLGDNYLQLTAKGLTKELGFVGYYGEVLDWMSSMYEATRPAPDQPGDEKIKAQLVKAARARSVFRYPTLDDEGNRAMRAETIVGWRDEDHYPGDITYAERPTWDASAIEAPAATLDAHLVGGAQQMFADNQFFASIEKQLKEVGLRTTAGLLPVPDAYETLHAQAPSASRLPMSWDQPDFAWTDEEDGVIALKHGSEILYASLYWRARFGINNLARVHYLTPHFDRIAVVRQESEFEPYGAEYTRPDLVNMGFGNGGVRYPGDLHSAHAGEKLPIAKVPPGVAFKPGDENVYAGRAQFYQLQYGDYLVGMNMTKDKTFELKGPAGLASAPDLVSGKVVLFDSPVKVGPRSTVILYLGK